MGIASGPEWTEGPAPRKGPALDTGGVPGSAVGTPSPDHATSRERGRIAWIKYWNTTTLGLGTRHEAPHRDHLPAEDEIG
jgi:hypothetical protein